MRRELLAVDSKEKRKNQAAGPYLTALLGSERLSQRFS